MITNNQGAATTAPNEDAPLETGEAVETPVQKKRRAVDDTAIKWLAAVLVVAILVGTIAAPDAAAGAIGTARTFVTEYFTWFFVLFSVLALAICAWLAFGRYGRVRLGGAGARPDYSKFAWYSMLFACGQGIGLIFWSVAEPIMLKEESPLFTGADAGVAQDGSMAWSYFHWGLTAWAMYCIVAICLAYSHYNLGKKLTFRDAVVDFFPVKSRRSIGIVVEVLAILACVLGLATSFGFATLQFTFGLTSFTPIAGGMPVWITVVVVFAALTAVSVYFGISKGMKRISELNSILSIVLVGAVLLFGPAVYLLSSVLQTFGVYFQNFLAMSLWSESNVAAAGMDSWQDSWNGWWTVFIWCWVIAFSAFVGPFIARISRGRTIREFVVGVTVIPSVIVMVWIGVLGGAAHFYDNASSGAISGQIAESTESGLFAMLDFVPVVGTVLMVVSTILVATYYITSLDSGVHALSGFVASAKSPSKWFRVLLVGAIASVTVALLVLGGVSVIGTVQTGTIIGAFPLAFILIIMVLNFIKRLRSGAIRTAPPAPPALDVSLDGKEPPAPELVTSDRGAHLN
ncbi:BCCT family transporter [Arthrobacter sp. 35/47]|uniref:BCCT family transporter n=1 Tax=Arthrobacter sp. 35/47 TaxID=269454 RepID=UPI0004B5E5BD|nr:BCCT family transporter [Arthrobacter sp. 35/47]